MSQPKKVPFEKAFIPIPVGKLKIKESEYNPTGSTCVVDQGQNLVSGMTTRTDLQREDGPYIVFGDHTRIVKYIDFPFVVGADGVRLYKASEKYEPEFLYLFLTNSKLPEDGYGRHSKYLKELLVPEISKEKQRQIAARLKAQLAEVNTARQAAEAQQTEFDILKQAILKQAFEPQGQGEVVWGIKTSLGEICTDISYGVTTSAVQINSGTRLLRITDICTDGVNWETVPGCKISEKERIKSLLSDGDIVIARTGGTVGKSFLVKNPPEAVYASYLIRLRTQIDIALPEYIDLFLGSECYWSQLREAAQGAAQPNVNATTLSKIELILPPIKKQRQIAVRLKAQLSEVDKARQAAKAQLNDIKLLPRKILAQAYGDICP